MKPSWKQEKIFLLIKASQPVPPLFSLYKTLLCLSLCLFLGACGGTSSRSSSNTGNSSEEKETTPPQDPRECGVKNGKGKQSWNAKSGDWNDCEALSCNAGYDNVGNSGVCGKTPEGHYSIADSKERIACSAKPRNSSWTDATGLVRADECGWACNAGYDNQENNARCQTTLPGHYSPAGSNDRIACSGNPDDSSWTGATGLARADECEWTCHAGHDNQENNALCQVTRTGYYSLAGSKDRTACPTLADSTPVTSTGLASMTECFTCNGGYDNQEDSTRCQVTRTGHYSPAGNNDRTACPTPANSAAVTTTGLASTTECFTCNGGFDNQEDSTRCQTTIKGHYSPADSNGRIACSAKPDDSSWTDATGLVSADECEWTCNAGHDNQEDSTLCEATIEGHYSPAGNNDRTACPTPADSTSVTTTGLASANKCFTCNTVGYVPAVGRCERERIALAAGHSHTCAILNDDGNNSNGGSVKCWGNNTYRQTGGGTPLASGKTATHITAGNSHTCAILTGGTVKCWGSNSHGKTGGGTPLASGKTATAISAGSDHTCAILSDKTVKCWGRNNAAQIGGAPQVISNSVVSGTVRNPLTPGETATAIEAGSLHTCAILTGGSVKCWGWKGSSQSPQTGKTGSPFSQGETAIALAAGYWHTCAILTGGAVKCWGVNGYGQLGRGGHTGMGTPLAPGKTATAISAWNQHTCAILSDKTVKCWGESSSRQIGGGTPSQDYVVSGTRGTPLSQGETATHIAVGQDHSCAILSDKTVKCWGKNNHNQSKPY